MVDLPDMHDKALRELLEQARFDMEKYAVLLTQTYATPFAPEELRGMLYEKMRERIRSRHGLARPAKVKSSA